MNGTKMELVQQCLKQFELREKQLQQIQGYFQQEMEQALAQRTYSSPTLQMLPTYVRSTPQGTEKGNFLVLEIGTTGTILRVLWVTLTGVPGTRKKPIIREFTIPTEITQGPGEQLFDFAVGCLMEFLDQLKVESQVIQLGFNFSFPCQQTSLDKSILISWTKGFKCSDVEGQDVVKLLREAIQRQGVYAIDVIAIVNDTVGTMMGCDSRAQECEIGVVVDTGTNACYMEEVRHVMKLGEEQGRMCINIEWGFFGDNGILEPMQTLFDLKLDQISLKPKCQRFEKMIGGMYLGELVRLVLIHLTDQELLFGGIITPALLASGSVRSEHVIEIEDPSQGRARAQTILQGLGLNPSIQECKLVQMVCEAVTTRAAHLCAAALTAILQRIMHNQERSNLGMAVATGGYIFEKHPRFSTIFQQTVKALMPDSNITFVPSEDGRGWGVAMVTAVASRMILHRQQLEETLAQFKLNSEQLKVVKAQMLEAMTRGLRGEESSLSMLPTYVRSTPDGTERGDFLALDLGDTNFQVLCVKVDSRSNGGIKITNQVFTIPDNIYQDPGYLEKLFDHIVDCIVNFQKQHDLSGKSLPLAFTFSFPYKQISLDKVIFLNWIKDFKALGGEDKDVVVMLQDAIKRRKGVELKVMTIINDTVDTMMSCGYEDPNCEVGIIVGTGTNACYMEEMCNISAVPGDTGRMCINMDWGSFGEDGVLHELYTPFDIHVDQSSLNPNRRSFEKLVSGLYLGEIVRETLLHLTYIGTLLDGRVHHCLLTKDSLDTKFLSGIESALRRPQVQAMLKELGLPASCDDALMVREVCQTISLRAAQLCGAATAAVVEKMRESRGLDKLSLTVGVDGSLYRLHPFFSHQVKATVEFLAPRCSVRFLRSEHGHGRGAALAAAVACRPETRPEARQARQARQEARQAWA